MKETLKLKKFKVEKPDVVDKKLAKVLADGKLKKIPVFKKDLKI